MAITREMNEASFSRWMRLEKAITIDLAKRYLSCIRRCEILARNKFAGSCRLFTSDEEILRFTVEQLNKTKIYSVQKDADLCPTALSLLEEYAETRKVEIEESIAEPVTENMPAAKCTTLELAGVQQTPCLPATEPTKEPSLSGHSIEDLHLSYRSIHHLTKAGYHTIEELLPLTEEQLYAIPQLGKTSVTEILHAIESLKQSELAAMQDRTNAEAGAQESASTVTPYMFEKMWNDSRMRPKILSYAKEYDVSIDQLDLSVRAKNCLKRCSLFYVSDLLFLTETDLLGIRNMGKNSSAEVLQAVEKYRDAIFAYCSGKPFISTKKEAISDNISRDIPRTFEDMWADPSMRPKILSYAKEHDVSFKQLGLSVRAKNCLENSSLFWISDLLFLTEAELLGIRNMGKNSVAEILQAVAKYQEENWNAIFAFCTDDASFFFSEDALAEKILAIYQDVGFHGFHFQDIVDRLSLPDNFDLSIIKKVVGRLIREGDLEYVDFMCYRVYPSFPEVLEDYQNGNERGVKYIREKLSGMTLEEIGQAEGLTRERIRQVIFKTMRKITDAYRSDTGLQYFDEDYYRHFFTEYALERSVCLQWLGFSKRTYALLDLLYDKGKKDLDDALDDPELDVGLKLKISNYLNRNKILIDGTWVEKKRPSLETFVLRKYCRDELSFEEFVNLYNVFLKESDIPNTEDLYLTQNVARTRINHISESPFVLWKQNQRLRYYDIHEQDYSELLDALQLESYENIEISTLKFLNDYPELMQRYDIRDEYELHNLLRKTIPEGSYHELSFERMPILRFGQFDRSEAVRRLIFNNAPITKNELLSLLQQEYGYDAASFAGNPVLNEFDIYYHSGMYRIDFKEMPPEHLRMLKLALSEDYYTIEQVQQIYASLFPDAQAELINPYNLKKLGFQVYSQYILKNYPTIDAYFRSLLTSADRTNLLPLKSKFSSLCVWHDTFRKCREQYEILEYTPSDVISIRVLEKAGVTKEMLKSFCKEAVRFAKDQSFFTIASLRKDGFRSPLDELGFDDWFYNGLLRYDKDISYNTMLGGILLYKGESRPLICAFVASLLPPSGSIDLLDVIAKVEQTYGFKVKYKGDITERIQNSELFYDPILERIYANEELYYRELDLDFSDSEL